MGFGEFLWGDRSIDADVWEALDVAADMLIDIVSSDLDVYDSSDELIELLPRRYVERYDTAFQRRFLEVMCVVRAQLIDEKSTRQVETMAEQIALGLFEEGANGHLETLADLKGLSEERIEKLRSQLHLWTDTAFPDPDHKFLYSGRLDGIEHRRSLGIGRELQFEHWFDRLWPQQE